MRSLVFDAGPIITLSMNNLLWLLEIFKKRFDGEFYISESVKYEVIDRPIEGKKFKFEALQTLVYVKNHTLQIYKGRIRDETNKLAKLINSLFSARGNDLQIVHLGEVESLAIVLKLDAETLVVDERTIRLLIEAPMALHELLQRKLHTKITINKPALEEFRRLTSNVQIIRSVEIATRAYELGLLDKYLPYDLPDAKKELLTAVLWGMKLDGCSISQKEIDDIVDIEGL